MFSALFRNTIFTKSTLCQLNCSQFISPQRTIFFRAVLGVDLYLKERQILEERLGNTKEKFLSKVAANVEEKQHIYTDDVKTLMYLTREKEQLDLLFEALKLYKEQQEGVAFPSFFKYAEMLLQMLYVNEEVQVAYDWFYKQHEKVQPSCRNKACYLLMLDMLYKARRFDDVVTLSSTINDHFLELDWMLNVPCIAALYEIGTAEALLQLQSVLNEYLIAETQLPGRCLMYSAMLAYKQEQYELMLEMLELPIFVYSLHKNYGKGVNIKLLAYAHIDRSEEAVQLLQSIRATMPRSFPIIFPCVLEKLKDSVTKGSDEVLKGAFHDAHRSLMRGGFVMNRDLENYLSFWIGYKEINTVGIKIPSRRSNSRSNNM